MKYFVHAPHYWACDKSLATAIRRCHIDIVDHPLDVYCENLQQGIEDDLPVKGVLDDAQSSILNERQDIRLRSATRITVLPLQDGWEIHEVSPIDGSATFDWKGEGPKPEPPAHIHLLVHPTGRLEQVK